MPQIRLPNPLDENRSDQREVFTLINAMRAAFLLLTNGGPGSLPVFTMPIGRGDTLSTRKDGVELIVISFEMPFATSNFVLNISGQAMDTAGAGLVIVRLGGTWGNLDGVKAVSAPITSTGFFRFEQAVYVTGNSATLIQVTIQSSVNNTTSLRGAVIIGN